MLLNTTSAPPRAWGKQGSADVPTFWRRDGISLMGIPRSSRETVSAREVRERRVRLPITACTRIGICPANVMAGPGSGHEAFGLHPNPRPHSTIFAVFGETNKRIDKLAARERRRFFAFELHGVCFFALD